MDEKEAAVQYLGTIERLKYFNKLKHELKTQVTRYLIANPSKAKNKDKALYEDCYRNFASYKILLLNNKRKAAMEMAKNLLPKLKKIELHSLMHTVANDLLFHHSSIEVSSQLANKNARLAQEQLEILNIESKVRRYHSRTGLIRNTRESYTPAVVKELLEAAEQSLRLLRPGLHHINRLIYTIVVCRYMSIYDYANVIAYCNMALESFPEDHPNNRSLRFIFMYNKIPAQLALGKAEEAKKIAKAAGKIVPVGNFNWHLVLLKRIVVCLHGGDYQEAYELYKAHTQHESPYPILIEYWNILRGYIYFLIKAGKIEAYEEERFYLGKFLNEMPIYSRDKAGNNINILVIQILIRMQREQFGHIIDRIESLREYARTYTRNPETKRANIFINMIIKMEAAQFHRQGTENKTARLFERLEATPLKPGQNLAVEVIPYQVLWEEILRMLENKFRARTVRRISTKESKNKKS